MENSRKSVESFKITFPKIPPHKSVTEYHKSRAALRQIQLRAYSWDKPRHDPRLDLTETRRIYDKTEEALSQKREHFKRERLKLDQQWKELEDKERELRESFEKLDLFVTTNEEKRERAQTKWREDSQRLVERSQKIERLKEELVFMEEAKRDLGEEIAKHMLYEKFLNSVSEKSEEMRKPHNIINRYESLMTTKNDLGELQNSRLDDLEDARARTVKLCDDNILKILGLNNLIGSLNTRYSTALKKAMYWEGAVWAIKDRAFATYIQINEVKQSCWNIYMLMAKRKGEVQKLPPEDFEGQLHYIKKTLRELRLVREEAKLVSSKSFSSIKAQGSQVSEFD